MWFPLLRQELEVDIHRDLKPGNIKIIPEIPLYFGI